VTLIIVWQGLGRLYELCSIVAVAPLPARNSFLAILLLFFYEWVVDGLMLLFNWLKDDYFFVL